MVCLRRAPGGVLLGLDRTLEVNTVKRRTLSLYEQGCF